MKWWLALLIIPVVYSAGIDKTITTAVLEDSSAEYISQYIIISEGAESINIPVPSDVQSVTADIDDEQRECKIVNSTALCGSTEAGTHVFTLKYTSAGVIANLENRKLFKFNEQLPFRTNEYTFILKLPVGTIIPQEGKDLDFFLTPKPAQVLSDGQRIIITWNASDTNNFAVSAIVQPLQEITLPIVIGLIILGAGAGALLYYIKKRKSAKSIPKKKTPKPKKEETLVPQFIEHEQSVVKLISEAPNKEIWQKEILAKTGFSKAKLSRIIRNLEERGVVVKTIYGNTNKISIKK